MQINYAMRSKFTVLCQQHLAAQQSQLKAGRVVSIPLEAGGYSGQVTVTIQADDTTAFETNWKGNDATRFPARIKAVATALRDCGGTGAFMISHADGMVSVQRAQP